VALNVSQEELLVDLVARWVDRDILWDEWLKALRSGRYRQGTRSLLREGCYCSLGVLCSVSDVMRPTYPWGRDASARFAGRVACLPEAICEFMDMDPYGMFLNAVPAFKLAPAVPRMEYPAGSIISLNDTARWSFDAQAEYLREHRNNLRKYGA
jgi:hypothetical protein